MQKVHRGCCSQLLEPIASPEFKPRPSPVWNSRDNKSGKDGHVIATEKLWSRRRFLGATASAVTACLERMHGAQDRTQAKRKYGGYPMGIHGASLAAFGNEAAAEMVATLELHWLELTAAQIRLSEVQRGSAIEPAASPQEIRELRSILAASDITPTAFGPIQLGGEQDSNRRVFDRASSLGIRNLSCIPELSALDDLESLADEHGVRLALHNNTSGHLDSIAAVRRAVQGRGPNVGACLDIGNALRGSEDPAAAAEALGPRLLGIHLKDVSARRSDSEVIVIGAGFLDVSAFFNAVRNVGFPDDGALSLEYLARPDDPLPGLREGLQVASVATQRYQNPQ